MITGRNESKTLRKYITCKCKCTSDGRKCNSDQWSKNDKCRCKFKILHYVEKIILGIMLHVIMKMENI